MAPPVISVPPIPGERGSQIVRLLVPGAMPRDLDAQIAGRRLTPMLEQYVQAKRQVPPEAILFFRMGDFFELFFDDAEVAARELDLTLTSRDKDCKAPIPMAGVPHHAAAGYFAKLVERGFSVAVCDQVEDPKQAKGIVRREVTRLVTPGTVADLEAMEPGAAHYLGCVAQGPDASCVLALLDLLAGEILLTRVPRGALRDEVTRMHVRELLVVDLPLGEVRQDLADLQLPLREAPWEDNRGCPKELYAAVFGEAGETVFSLCDGGEVPAMRTAVVTLVDFAENTQRRKLQHLQLPRLYRIQDYLLLDEATRRNLELVKTQHGDKRGSLLWHMDCCGTAMGSRMLAQWLNFPLRRLGAIKQRADVVEALVGDRMLRQDLQAALKGVRDIERLLGRVAVGRANPRDLAALRESLQNIPQLRERLAGQPGALGQGWRETPDGGPCRQLLESALVEEPPVSIKDGGIFKEGFQPELDKWISLATTGHGYLDDLEKREREKTQIAKLKVRYNKVFGYYIEVSKANLSLVPERYIRKQTLVNAERYITEELKEFETQVMRADEERKTREEAWFLKLVQQVAQHIGDLRQLAQLVAQTDCFASLAQVAEEGRYCRPQLCEASELDLRGCRHPVVERLMPGGEPFVPNDIALGQGERRLLIVTGPNMAGKSTVMRQVALCSLMAHMGGFVPADSARVGLCDRIFTRVGASDNLGRGQSTFMVEMIETATILAEATDASLVLLDEIGRGTSTYDGVSIAWAVAEYLHDVIRCRGLFATHYHELTDLAVGRAGIQNVSVAVKEDRQRIVFLRRLVDGAANRSYGVHVARLAGVHETVLGRAREILEGLESTAGSSQVPKGQGPRMRRGGQQLALFESDDHRAPAPAAASAPAAGASIAATPSPELGRLRQALEHVDVLRTTPMAALGLLAELKDIHDDIWPHDNKSPQRRV